MNELDLIEDIETERRNSRFIQERGTVYAILILSKAIYLGLIAIASAIRNYKS